MADGEGHPENNGDGEGGGAGDGEALALGHALGAGEIDGDAFERIDQHEDGDEDLEIFGEVVHVALEDNS